MPNLHGIEWPQVQIQSFRRIPLNTLRDIEPKAYYYDDKLGKHWRLKEYKGFHVEVWSTLSVEKTPVFTGRIAYPNNSAKESGELNPEKGNPDKTYFCTIEYGDIHVLEEMLEAVILTLLKKD